MTNRHVTSPFWTRETDALLKKLEAAGLSFEKIGKRLGLTPSAVQRRSYHLRGLEFHAHRLRASDVRNRNRDEREAAALQALRAALREGIPRDTAIAEALKAGVRAHVLADEFGLNPRSVYRIVLLEKIPRSPRGRRREGANARSQSWHEVQLKAKRAERRKEKEQETRAAIAAMHAAIARGVPRNAAIAQAIKSDVTYKRVGKEFGLSRQRVHQIALTHEALALHPFP